MTNNEHRAIEVEFYCVIQLLFNIKKDANFLVAMLEGLHFIVNFNVEKVVHYANKFNLDILWRPYQGEVVGLLFKYSDLPMNAVCKALNISRPTGYKLAETFLNDPTDTNPKVPKADLPELQAVISAYKIMRERIRSNG